MADYGPETYGDAFADVYDEWYGELSNVEHSTDAVCQLAQDGRVLELGVGTGRLALPIARRGVEVVGVDASQAMLDHLSRNDPTATVRAIRADMAVELPEGPFEVVFVAYNTFFNLTTTPAQRSCLELVRSRLSRTGHFLIEAFVPSTAGPDRGVEGRPTTDGVVLNVTVRDHEAQIVRGQQVEITEEGPTLRPWQIHYQTPDQLDDLALDAGLQLVARWGDWTGSRFDEHSSRHVSVYAPRRAS